MLVAMLLGDFTAFLLLTFIYLIMNVQEMQILCSIY